MSPTRIAAVRSARIQTPVPQREHQNIGRPQRARGEQQPGRRLAMRGKGSDQKHQRHDHLHRQQRANREAEDAIESMLALTMEDNRRDKESADYGRKEPARANGEPRRQGQVEAGDGENGDQGGPSRFGRPAARRRWTSRRRWIPHAPDRIVRDTAIQEIA